MNKVIKTHQLAAKRLEFIKDSAFSFIEKNLGNISEYDVVELILREFRKQNLAIDKKNPIPIVAVNENAAIPHYFPSKRKSRVIKKNSLVLIDIWARIKEKKSVFADITWVAYFGRRVPKKIQKAFQHVIEARDSALRFIKEKLKEKELPKAGDVDRVVRSYFRNYKLDKYFLHRTGHSLGFINCHGKRFNLSKHSKKRIQINVPFTIEPGLYFKGKFGIRSEIDCYITKDFKLKVTTRIQKAIETF